MNEYEKEQIMKRFQLLIIFVGAFCFGGATSVAENATEFPICTDAARAQYAPLQQNIGDKLIEAQRAESDYWAAQIHMAKLRDTYKARRDLFNRQIRDTKTKKELRKQRRELTKAFRINLRSAQREVRKLKRKNIAVQTEIENTKKTLFSTFAAYQSICPLDACEKLLDVSLVCSDEQATIESLFQLLQSQLQESDNNGSTQTSRILRLQIAHSEQLAAKVNAQIKTLDQLTQQVCSSVQPEEPDVVTS